MKVALCIPVHSRPETQFMACLIDLVIYTLRERPDIDARTIIYGTSDLCSTRHELVKAALEAGADWLLLMDCDHTFPRDALLRLLGHGLDAVGINYPRRQGHEPTAARDGATIPTNRERAVSHPLEPVDQMGLGLVLVNAKLVGSLGFPMFQFVPGRSGHSNHGEDYFFWQRVKAAGVVPHLDNALSVECGHVSQVVISFG